MRDHRVRHALFADERCKRPRIDAGEADDTARLQPIVEAAGGAVVRGRGDVRMQDHAAGAGARGHVHALDVFFVGSHVADVRKREGDDLPGIGWIGEDFLVARHGRIEADFAGRMARRTKSHALQYGSVGQHQQRGSLGLGCVL